MNRTTTQVRNYLALMLLAAAPKLMAQAAPQPASPAADAADETITLDPFSVSASEEKDGYQVKDTLAGTRVRTDLKDVASSISVVNKQLLSDLGATNNETLLQYTSNTEVGGMQGNYSGMGGGSTYNETAKLLRPSSNNRVRGLDAADGTRDFFMTEIPWDSYNVGRVDLQRGPNSILFGVGSPAGIVNASLNEAGFKQAGQFETRIDGFGSFRNSMDYNHVLIKKTLSVRVAVLDDMTSYRQKPAFNHDRRYYGALRFDPKIFGADHKTSIKVNFEKGDVTANRPRMMPPVDGISSWFNTKSVGRAPGLNKLTLDPNTTWNPYSGTSGVFKNYYPWMSGFMGRLYNANMTSWYNAGNSTPTRVMVPVSSSQRSIDVNWKDDDQGIAAIPFTHLWATSGYSMFASHSYNDWDVATQTGIWGGSYWSDYSMTDASVYDFYNKLIDGENKAEWQNWKSANINVTQTFFNDRVGVNLAYNNQAYHDGQVSALQGGEFLMTVDMNTRLADGSINPNVGRVAVGNNGQYGNGMTDISRDNMRATVYGDLRFEDIFGKGTAADLLGHHVFTGLVSEEQKVTKSRSFVRWLVDKSFADRTGQTPTTIEQGVRQWEWLAYLGDSMLNRSSASGMNLSNLNMKIAPSGQTSLRYFDSTWNKPSSPSAAGYVNPNAPFSYTVVNADNTVSTAVSTQNENPANYVGWTTGSFNTYQWDSSSTALDKLTYKYTGQRKIISSQGYTWQGYMLQDALVPTIGWRRDIVRGQAAAGKTDADNAISDYNLDYKGATHLKVTGENTSYGIVARLPRSLRAKMPLGTDISVFYNTSENFKADTPRADIAGNLIDNQRGKTKEYGFGVETLDGKLSLKTIWYKTNIYNADLGYSNAGLGNNLYYAWAIPTWLPTHALCLLDAANAWPSQPYGGWPWNNVAGIWNDSAQTDLNVTRAKAIVKDVFNNFPADQHYMDEYGIPFNLAKMKSSNEADWTAAIPKGHFWDLGYQPLYKEGFKSTGSGPVATVDTESKGVEFEVTAKPLKNWNVTVNFSKTTAVRNAISPTLTNWIETWTKYLNGDAGLITMWGGNSFRSEWQNKILAPYNTLTAQMGSSAPEIAPYRLNMINSYSFDRGVLKGAWVGGAFRWEDKRVLGYALNTPATTAMLAKDPAYVAKIDINKPYYSASDSHFDLWVGYGHKVTKSVDWQIQLNMRNFLESKKLVPVTINPDGSKSVFRIQEGMTWQLTNTFKF